MIQAVLIADQGVGYATQIKQAVPISVVARDSGDFDGQDQSDLTQGNVCGHRGEACALRTTGTGLSQIFIDDLHLLL